MTPLDKPLKRTLEVKGGAYVLTLTPESLKITEKGHRLGVELKWEDLISGDSALAIALHASVGKFQNGAGDAHPKSSRPNAMPRASKEPKGAAKSRTPLKRKKPKRAR